MSTNRRRCSKKPEARLTEEKSPSPWQCERANRLHRLFLRVEAAVQSGKSIWRAVKGFEWYVRRRYYRCAPHMKIRASASTLYRLFLVWRTHGRKPAALRLNYCAGVRRVVSEAWLVRFLKFCDQLRSTRSLLSAYKQFAALGLSVPVTYGTVIRYYSPARYRAIQRAFQKIASTEDDIRQLRAENLRRIRALRIGKGASK